MPNLSCESNCKYQKRGECTLEQANWVRINDGAECMVELLAKEKECHC